MQTDRQKSESQLCHLLAEDPGHTVQCFLIDKTLDCSSTSAGTVRSMCPGDLLDQAQHLSPGA